MRGVGLLILVALMSACASTGPALETARLTGEQLLRLETELAAAAGKVRQKYEQQQRFAQQSLIAARDAEETAEALRRELLVSGNKEALRIYSDVISSRPEGRSLPAVPQTPPIAIDTTSVKKVIVDLGAIGAFLAERDQVGSYIEFVDAVQDSKDKLRASDDRISGGTNDSAARGSAGDDPNE